MTNAMSLPSGLSLGSLDNYIKSVGLFPILSKEREVELAARFKQENDLEAAREMVTSHLRLVVSIARGYAGYGLPQADLIQEGNIGLMKAVKHYDSVHGVRLVTFAMQWIKSEINDYVIKNWRMVKIATTKAQRKLFFNLRSLKTGFETLKPNQVSDIALKLAVSEQDVIEMETRFAGYDHALETSEYDSDDENNFSPIHYLADKVEHEPFYIIAEAEQEFNKTTGLKNALAELDERSRRIVESRWLCEEGQAATLHELAAEFNVSAERIRQLEQKAMKKIKETLIYSR
jgi:RNA polymerase sigma-32 factor